MKNRKRQVIENAFELFTTKGFQATSIQDILEHSSISKGTFYNYFSSKQEIFIAAIMEMHHELVEKREKYVLHGQVDNKEFFINQIIMTMDSFSNDQTSILFSEVLSSNQHMFKKDMQKILFQHLQWIIKRLQDLFGPQIYPYVLDLSIIFTDLLIGFFRYSRLHLQKKVSNEKIVRFSFKQLEVLVEHALSSKEILLPVELFEQCYFPYEEKKDFSLSLMEAIGEMKEVIQSTLHNKEQIDEQIHLLDFLLEELLQTKQPRETIIRSTLYYLKHKSQPQWKQHLQTLCQIIKEKMQ